MDNNLKIEKKNSIINFIVEYTLNPISPITILVIGIFLNILIEKKENLPECIKSIISFFNTDVVIVILISWAILVIIYYNNKRIQQAYERQIYDLNKEIERKDRQIDFNSGMISKKYGELAKFNEKEVLYKLIKEIVKENSIIQTAQIYSYTSKVENRKDLKIKLKYEQGYVYEGVESNTILQSYFKIPLEYYSKFQEIHKLLISVAKDNFESDEIIEMIYIDIEEKAMELVEDIHNELMKINTIDDINNEIVDIYRLLIVLLGLLQNDYESGIIVERVLAETKKELEEYIIKYKRTGILGSILIEDYYLFKHSGDTEKNGRFYLTYYFKVYGKKYIMLITLPSFELEGVEDFKWNRKIEDIIGQIILKINNSFK